jgi:hypothetical protein
MRCFFDRGWRPLRVILLDFDQRLEQERSRARIPVFILRPTGNIHPTAPQGKVQSSLAAIQSPCRGGPAAPHSGRTPQHDWCAASSPVYSSAASLLLPGIEADEQVVIMLLVDLRVVHCPSVRESEASIVARPLRLLWREDLDLADMYSFLS